MQRVELFGPDDVRLVEVGEPKPGPRDAVVKVHACGICGSDLGYIKLGGMAGPGGKPMPLGHELAGTVEAVGEEVDGFAPGTRVVVNPLANGNAIGNGGPQGGFAPYLLVPNAAAGGALFEVPDGMPLDIAALAEPVGVGMNAVDQVGAQPGDKVVVFGAGPIGLTAVASLRHGGFEDVIAVDLSARRLGIAAELGARETINATHGDVWERLRELHGTEALYGMSCTGTDAYVEASGAQPVIPQILSNAKPNARLSIVALHRSEVPVNFLLVMMKQLHLVGAMEYPDDYTRTLELLSIRDMRPLLTHHFALDCFDEALAVARDPAAGGKIMIEVS
ncbi:MAG: zinc-binding dehydrogenase [Deltaproteobacteria bacterium]|nr:zinc-binding dehydrogenase [Deltaproteobacteria bacterium]